MERRSFLYSSGVLLGASMIGPHDGHADQAHAHVRRAASLMTECANRFLAALDANQRGKATLPFDAEERLNWHFIPRERKGLPLREMSPYQKHLASALLAGGLSQTGYIKAVTIMSLEDVLKIMENDSGERRNPEKYYFSVFGSPTDAGTWGYRVEGHHLSQNYTVVNGEVIDGLASSVATPPKFAKGRARVCVLSLGKTTSGSSLFIRLTNSSRRSRLWRQPPTRTTAAKSPWRSNNFPRLPLACREKYYTP